MSGKASTVAALNKKLNRKERLLLQHKYTVAEKKVAEKARALAERTGCPYVEVHFNHEEKVDDVFLRALDDLENKQMRASIDAPPPHAKFRGWSISLAPILNIFHWRINPGDDRDVRPLPGELGRALWFCSPGWNGPALAASLLIQADHRPGNHSLFPDESTIWLPADLDRPRPPQIAQLHQTNEPELNNMPYKVLAPRTTSRSASESTPN
ncbi:hypothetical protein PG989_000023 [Apiospora arundinis]